VVYPLLKTVIYLFFSTLDTYFFKSLVFIQLCGKAVGRFKLKLREFELKFVRKNLKDAIIGIDL
jgi:hypothetical protein